MSGVPVLQAALWFSMLASLAVGAMSWQAGAAPEWVVLRAVGAFSALMVLGLIATAVASQGLRRRPPPASGGGGGGAEGALDAEILTAAEMREGGHE